VRKLYHLAEKTNSLPFFPSGSKLAIRKSVVRAHVWAKERKAFSTEKEEQLVQLAILLSKLLALVRQSNPSRPSVDPTAIHLWTGLLYEISRAIDKILNEP
jgi:hypothetical protein